MGTAANKEKRTKQQGPNIKTPTDIGNSSKQRETNQKTRTQHKLQQTMGITANTEERTKTQGPNIKTPTDIGNSSKHRETNQKQGPNINSNRQWELQQTQRNEPKHKAPT